MVAQNLSLPKQNLRSSFNSFSCGIGEKLSSGERKAQAQAFLNWKNNLASTTANAALGPFTIPIVFHLVEETPLITDAQLTGLVSSLNSAFAHSDGYSGGSGGVDYRHRFLFSTKIS